MYHPQNCGSRGGGRHSKFPLSSLRAARDVAVTPCQRSKLQISVSLDGPGGARVGLLAVRQLATELLARHRPAAK